jgi:hypothetical protein
MAAKKRTQIIRGFLLLFFLAAIGLGITFVWSTMSEERRVAALRAKGYPVTLAELYEWYEKPPPGENAASLYMEAGKQFSTSDYPELETTPVFGAPDAVLGTLGATVPDDELERISAFLNYHADTYALLEEASHLAQSRYPIDASLFYMDHYSLIRSAWRGSLLQAQYHIAKQDGARAAESFRQLAHITNSLAEEPLTTTVATRTSLLQGAVGTAEYGLNSLAFTEDAFEIMDDALLSLMENDHVLRAAVGNYVYEDALLKSGVRTLGIVGDFSTRGKYIESNLEMIRVAEMPFRESIPEWISLSESSVEPGVLHRIPWLDEWITYIPPPTPEFFALSVLIQYRSHGRLAAARAALRIEHARAEGISLPASIDELPAKYTEDWPEDPFSGEPIKYRPGEIGYITYSVSVNMTDEGGLMEAESVGLLNALSEEDASIRVLR